MRMFFACLMLVVSCMAFSQEVPKDNLVEPSKAWDTADKALAAGALAGLLVDWSQTHYIVNHPQQYYETNIILGSHPSSAKVDLYFVSVTTGMFGLGYVLPPDARKFLFGSVLVIEAISIINNHSIGIKAAF